MDDYINSFTDNLLNTVSTQIKKKKNREKIMKTIIEPVLEDINKKYYPHYVTLISLFIMITAIIKAATSDWVMTGKALVALPGS